MNRLHAQGLGPSNPEYAKLMAAWHALTAAGQPQPVGQAALDLQLRTKEVTEAAVAEGNVRLADTPTDANQDQLKSQIMAYKFLSKNAQVPSHIQLV